MQRLALQCFRGGGSLKASLTRVFSLAKNEQENSEQVIKKRCHAELDSASNHLGVLQGFEQCVGLKAQPTVDSHMLSLREGQSPTKQSTCLYGLPRILTNARNDKMAGICERDGLISHNALSPYRPNALLTKCSTLVLRLAMNATARFCAKSSTLLSSQARLFASKACFVAPLGLAFTMAEILLSLTIIGVVAAITLPSLTGNINERTWNTQRKALYSRISQAVSLMPALNGYGTLSEDEDGNVIADTAAETFLSAGLSKVLKINNICDSEHLQDCGINSSYINLRGSKKTVAVTLADYNSMFTNLILTNGYSYSQINTKAAAFETANGESVLTYYNPYCRPSNQKLTYSFSQPYMCANFIYDLNGKKGPNTIGKDMGVITAIYPTDSFVVAPMSFQKQYNIYKKFPEAKKYCKTFSDDSRLPDIEELMAIFYNKDVFEPKPVDGAYWSNSVAVYGKIWRLAMSSGARETYNSDFSAEAFNVICVKRN